MKITTIILTMTFLAMLVPSDKLLANPESEFNNDRYRVEIILFQMLESNATGRRSNALSQYAQVADEDEALIILGDDHPQVEEEIIEETEELAQSEVMANVWKRLRASREFRPLVYQQWQEQRADTVARAVAGGVIGTATRVHDENIIFTSPILEESFGFTTEDELENNIDPNVYQLDGLATFSQGRFLHIGLDFEYRQLLVQSEATGNSDKPNTYMLFSLEKSRQIRPQRIELFDNERFGALVYLEEINQTEEPPEDLADAES